MSVDVSPNGQAYNGARPDFEPARPDFRDHVREVFQATAAMQLIGATLGRIEPGLVELELVRRDAVTQQHGYVHGGILGLLADGAAALAALTVAPAKTIGLTVEYKINLLEPADGERILARGRLVRSGHAVSVAACDVYALDPGAPERLVATATVTLVGAGRRPAGGGRGTPRDGSRE